MRICVAIQQQITEQHNHTNKFSFSHLFNAHRANATSLAIQPNLLEVVTAAVEEGAEVGATVVVGALVGARVGAEGRVPAA
jgi:DNA-directed RNA polymerase subunit E'/Rpb7